jgi:hypothetical protein
MLTIALIESDDTGFAIPDTHWRLVIAAGKAREIAAMLALQHGAIIEHSPIDAIQERRKRQGLAEAI